MNNNGKTHERRNYVFKNEDEENDCVSRSLK